MPDMGFPHDRRDDTSRPPPHDWREALSTLPLDTPDGDGWARLAACLPVAGAGAAPDQTPPSASRRVAAAGSGTRATPGRRRHHPLPWLALAAVLAVVVAIPLQQLRQATPERAQPPATQTTKASTPPAGTASSVTPSAEKAPTQAALASGPTTIDTPPTVAAPPRASDPDTADARRTAAADSDHAAGTNPPAPARTARRASRPAVSMPNEDKRAAPAADARIASADTSSPLPADPLVADKGSGADDDLERLYAESARLEALVAIARDDSVASAPATLLTASLDERIGHIDGALSQAGLERGQRLQLWQSRVEALRELAGVETTQRWLSARGETWEAGLVLVD